MSVWALGTSLASAAIALACVWRVRRLHAALRAERAQAATQSGEREALARTQAAATERERIYTDLHDDLGAKLLGMIHASDSPAHADSARALLQDLRDVVTRSRGAADSLHDVLADIRTETAHRLAAVDIALAWEVADALPDPAIDADRALHLYRIVREAISNAIRHAEAARVRVRIRAKDGTLYFALSDDGSGTDAGAVGSGRGVSNMRGRAAQLDGAIDWTPATNGGTKVLLTIPLAELSR
ncbi:MAG: ATP-binding protein [Dokdonella sp.]